MKLLDQRICAWSGIIFMFLMGCFMVMPGFVPPPSPSLDASHIAAIYRERTQAIRIGTFLAMYGAIPYTMFIGVISVQMFRIKGISRLTPYLQLVAGIGAVLVYLLPVILFAVIAFRPERDPALTLFGNDIGWQFIITNVPIVQVQFGAIALAVLQDKSANPVFPRWIAYVNIWLAVIFVPAPVAFFFKTGPFAWNGLFTFWLPAIGFFIWAAAMVWALLRAISAEERERAGSGVVP